MQAALVQFVRLRAKNACEYRHLPEELSTASSEVDHIIAKKHLGATVEENLALACFQCNGFKGPNIAGIDPATLSVVPLFHPRLQRWREHFEWNGAELVGLTAVGRATIQVLNINLPVLVEIRQAIANEGERFDTSSTEP